MHHSSMDATPQHTIQRNRGVQWKNSDKGKITLQAMRENTKHLHSEQGRTDHSGKPLHSGESIVPREGTLSAPAKLYNNERHTVGCKGNGKKLQG